MTYFETSLSVENGEYTAEYTEENGYFTTILTIE